MSDRTRYTADLVSDSNLYVNPINDRVGIGTLNPSSKLHVVGDVLISGVSTLGTVRISSGIVTATSGVVTYYGDGSNLTITNPGIGIATESGTVGTGATILDFRGTGISTVTVSSGIATINIIDTKSDISPVMMGMIF